LSASSDSIAGRRAWIALWLAVALLPLVGCKRAPAGRYQKDGLSFEHPAGWTVTKDTQKEARLVHVDGPDNALVIISIFEPHLDVSLDTFVETATKTRREGIKRRLSVGGVNLGAEGDTRAPTPIERSVAGKKARGLEEHFRVDVLNHPVPHTAQYFIVTVTDRALIVLDQVADENRRAVDAGFQKVFDTIALVP
jgi:hypothetical protein